jgi:hypothetical protein
VITYTTSDLVTAVLGLAHIPEAQTTFQATDILRLADSAMRTLVSPKIVSVREGYWTTYQDYSISTSSDPIDVVIPALALGGAIVEVKLLVNNVYLPVDRLEISELTSTQFTPRPNYGYWIEDNVLKFLGNGGVTGTLRVWYNRMPSQLVQTSACGEITGISSNDVTVSGLPSTFMVGTELDIASAQPGFNVLLKDSAPTGINNSVITFTSVPSRVAVGDWVCLSGQSCVVQCPIEWVSVLEQAAVCKIYEAQGYLQKLAAAKASLKEMTDQVLTLIGPRQIQKTKFMQAGGPVLGVNRRKWPFAVGQD